MKERARSSVDRACAFGAREKVDGGLIDRTGVGGEAFFFVLGGMGESRRWQDRPNHRDRGGLIARHALAGDHRVRAMGLVNTEQPQGPSWRPELFSLPRYVPGFGAALGWAVGKR